MKLFSRRTKPTNTLPHRRRLSDDERSARGDLEQLPAQYSYRRNQTLTGSRTVASAGEQSAQRQSPRMTVHHLRRRRRRLGSVLFATLGAILFIAVLLNQFTSSVHISIYGQVRQAATANNYQQYAQAIDQYLSERPLQRFRSLLNTEQLHQYLQDHDMSEIQLVKSPVSDGYGEAQFELKMREPIARWEINGKQRFVDSTGAIFDKNYYADPQVNIIDEANLQTSDVRSVTSSRFLSFIGQSVGAFSTLKQPVSQMILPVDTTRQVIGVLDGYKIKLSVDREVGEQVEDAVRAVDYLKQQGIQTEYVDVRVSGKAFYR